MKIIHNNGLVVGAPDDLPVGRWDNKCPDSGNEWSLLALGDIGISGAFAHRADEVGSSYPLFGNIPSALHKADCVMANLETPLIDAWTNDKMFAGSSKWACDLKKAGIDVLHLASNHMLDHGVEGFSQTIESVKNAGLTIIGAGQTDEEATNLVRTEVAGLQLGWLAAGHTYINQPVSPRLWELDIRDLLAATEQARRQVDVLIVSLHWGPMLVDYPYLEQYHGAHQLVDAGASVVLMHHAHILQGVEIYCGAPICYSLGNFIFDHKEGEYQEKATNFTYVKCKEMTTGGIFSMRWRGTKLSHMVVAPIMQSQQEKVGENELCVTWASPEVANDILTRLNRISDDLNTDFSEKLLRQLSTMRCREIAIIFNIAFRHHEYWRLWNLAKSIRARHFLAFGKNLLPAIFRLFKKQRR